MRTLVRSVAQISLVVALAAVVAAAASSQKTDSKKKPADVADPAAVVTALYRDHFARGQEIESTFRRNRERFAPELRALLEKAFSDAAARPEELVGLDFNPLTNAQEDATSFEVAGTTRDGADAIVEVRVKFGAEPMPIRIRMTPSGATWLVANVIYEEGDLVGILKDPQ